MLQAAVDDIEQLIIAVVAQFYGNNRADYTFIPGGMIPGVTVIQPDYPELKDSWPFLWYENEYVVDAGTLFMLAANAADAVSR